MSYQKTEILLQVGGLARTMCLGLSINFLASKCCKAAELELLPAYTGAIEVRSECRIRSFVIKYTHIIPQTSVALAVLAALLEG